MLGQPGAIRINLQHPWSNTLEITLLQRDTGGKANTSMLGSMHLLPKLLDPDRGHKPGKLVDEPGDKQVYLRFVPSGPQRLNTLVTETIPSGSLDNVWRVCLLSYSNILECVGLAELCVCTKTEVTKGAHKESLTPYPLPCLCRTPQLCCPSPPTQFDPCKDAQSSCWPETLPLTIGN